MNNNKVERNVYLLAKSVPIDGSNNPEKVVASAVRFSYSNKNCLNIYSDLDNKKASNIITTINNSGETNYLKHISFTFGIENISRECAAEILNYALAASTKDTNDIKYSNRNLLITMTAEDLTDFFRDNCCSLAGDELNEVADKMLNICLQEAPTAFVNAGAPCTFEECDKKELSCNEKRRAKILQLVKLYK